MSVEEFLQGQLIAFICRQSCRAVTATVPEPSGSESTLAVRHWLERHKAGDAAARQELLDISMRRLRLLSRRILSDISAVRNFEETEDLLQNSVV